MSSMVLDGVSPRSRTSDPVTSVDAGRSARLHASQDAVLSFMRKYADQDGFTQGRLESYFPDWSPSRIRSAVSELEELDLVEFTGETRLTKYGRQARVYRAQPVSELNSHEQRDCHAEESDDEHRGGSDPLGRQNARVSELVEP